MSPWAALSLRYRRPAVPPPRPSRTLFFWLTGIFLLTLLPQVSELPVWIAAVTVGALVLRAALEIYRLPLPSTLFTSLLALCLLAAILLQFHTIAGTEAGTAFMAGLMAIKFYELRGPRDVSVVIFASLFIVMGALLYSRALELFIYCLIMMWLLIAALLRNSMGDRPDNDLLPMLGRAGLIFLQALPLALFLFFFLPRHTGKLQIPLQDAPVGLTDRVAPGSVARLASNNSMAMYVRFIDSNSIPAPETMYWRALVLWEYRDGAWTAGKMGSEVVAAPPKKDPNSTEFKQEITIQPHNQQWLFALDYPNSAAVNVDDSGTWAESEVLRGGILQVGIEHGRIDHTERYTVTSTTQLAPLPDTLEKVSHEEYQAATQLPGRDDPDPNDTDHIDPQVTALANQLYAANPNPVAYVSAVLRYLHQPGFKYTSSPGTTPPGRDWLPYFLFTTKAGYCEYFASAFAVLMRIEYVPTRLVIGYQGAEYNPYGDVYTVLQSNAHSWDEVWLDEKKRWWRIDPTSALPADLAGIAPADANQQEDDSSMQEVHRPPSFSETHFPAWLNHTLTELELRRAQIEVNWDDWVFSYNPDTQTRLAQNFGLSRQDLALVSGAAILVCFIILRRLIRQREVVSPIENLYAKFCRSMAQRGIPRAKWEGPLAYTDRVAETFPEKKEAIQHLGAIIARSRYGPGPIDPATPKELQALLTQIAASQAATLTAHE